MVALAPEALAQESGGHESVPRIALDLIRRSDDILKKLSEFLQRTLGSRELLCRRVRRRLQPFIGGRRVLRQ
ncbi:MAG: hypothetical protein C4321_09485, partial [Chloroflexota bacterium]